MNGEEIKNLTIPESMTSIGNYAFRGCSGLTSITIPNSVTSIGSSAFQSCKSLTSVIIPKSVTSIGYQAFYGCSLTSITIGSGVTSIGQGAFYFNNLTDVYCYAENVPSTDRDEFFSYSFPISSATLHVPAGSIEAYRTTAPWSRFGRIVAIE